MQKQGGFPTLDLVISEVKPQAPVDIQVPDNVRQAVVQVKTEKVADGVWYLTGGTHHKVFFEHSFAAPRTVQPDILTQSGKQATIEGMPAKRILADATRTVELYHIQGNAHHDGLIVAYLPKEKLLIEADAYTPAPPNAPPPAQPNPFSVNLYDNLERLQLAVEKILPLHGRIVPPDELRKAIGKSS
jgi:glyoxylase-like metal-dependent hydrolase (beta-lactamase superfamily II)